MRHQNTNNKPMYRRSKDTLVVTISILLMWLLYFAGSKFSGLIGDLIFIFGVIICLSTLLPVFYVKKYEHGKLSDLGIHTNVLPLSLGISTFFAFGSIFYYFQLAAAQDITAVESLRQLLWSMLMMWEVLFVFGWVFIRYYRAFGALTAVVLTESAFTVYHIGSMPLEQLVGLFFTGLVASAVFYFAKMNIFVLWPFAWGVAVAISTLQSKQSIVSWSEVLVVFAVLIAQSIIIWFIFKPEQGTY